jgi:hypothetical protein
LRDLDFLGRDLDDLPLAPDDNRVPEPLVVDQGLDDRLVKCLLDEGRVKHDGIYVFAFARFHGP